LQLHREHVGLRSEPNGRVNKKKDMSIYDPLYKWLHSKSANNISAAFEQIETVLGFKLPNTARERPQWWANEGGDTRHVQCRAWMDAGFQTRNLDLAKESVEFVKAAHG
jgi:hypothetical protein